MVKKVSPVVFGVADATQPPANTPPFGDDGVPSAIPPQTAEPVVGIGESQESAEPDPFVQPALVTLLLNASEEATEYRFSNDPSKVIRLGSLHFSSLSKTPSLSSSISIKSPTPSLSESVQV